MVSVKDQIQSSNSAITDNIKNLQNNRPLLSENVLSQLRNLIEGIAVLVHTGNPDTEFVYDPEINAGLAYIRANGKFSLLRRFHHLVQISASHYTPDGDGAERLMLKYYEYLYRLRDFVQNECKMSILGNLESFPLDLDPSLRTYYQEIAFRIDALHSTPLGKNPRWNRYYIQNIHPFFVNHKIYYEVTFTAANDRVSKFDRIIGFTDIDMTDKYATKMVLADETIKIFERSMPIIIISGWQVSIRPCEIEHFAELFDDKFRVDPTSFTYRYLMDYLTSNAASLLDIIDMPDTDYASFRANGIGKAKVSKFFILLDKTRQIVRGKLPGANVLRYLMLRMNNVLIKKQYHQDECGTLSDLKLSYGCIPFDKMPFCTFLPGHAPRFSDLADSLDMLDRDHELLARRVKENVEILGMLYTRISDLADFGDITKIKDLAKIFNEKLYYKHQRRQLIIDKQQIFIRGYEDDTVAIVKKLQEFAISGIDGYSAAVKLWLEQSTSPKVDDQLKRDALKRLFDQSRVAIIYGAAGTGKTTMINLIANYFSERSKLFLALTNPAVDNLRRRVNAANSSFDTIAAVRNTNITLNYDLLFIDECSTVSNADLLNVLNAVSCKLIVLVGDVFQIESIRFGNWFEIIKSFIPVTSVFELKNPYRTEDRKLIDVWSKVRNINDDITETLNSGGYSSDLDESLFKKQGNDGIILCLNYDGLYGINNINRFLQNSNPGKAVRRGAVTYKVGDPILFNETDRFKPLIYNNLKGWITDVVAGQGKITFDVKLDESIDASDTWDYSDLTWVGDSTVRFDVYEASDGDTDEDLLNTVIPFQIAYAVSIHKAQGLEYDFVKIVITRANEEDVTHNIFYTAITRARKDLRIFWTPETQLAVLNGFKQNLTNNRDVGLLASRCHLQKNLNTNIHENG
jgi:DNA replication protein DnaC